MIIIIIITFDGTINTKGMFLVLKWLLHWLPKMWWQNQVSSQAFMTDGDAYEKGEQSTCLIHVFDYVWIYQPVQGSQHSHWQNGHLWSQFYGEGGTWKWGLGLIGGSRVQDGEQCKNKKNIITFEMLLNGANAPSMSFSGNCLWPCQKNSEYRREIKEKSWCWDLLESSQKDIQEQSVEVQRISTISGYNFQIIPRTLFRCSLCSFNLIHLQLLGDISDINSNLYLYINHIYVSEHNLWKVFSSPWRAPGSSPVFDACGIAGWFGKVLTGKF